MKYWLMKSEPTTYSIDDLMAKPRGVDHWDGVRNYQARNFMLAELRKEKALAGMLLLKKGMRLSVQPVTRKEFDHIVAMVEKGGKN
jgi:predicted RNA-binding protein with PUA-like domain